MKFHWFAGGVHDVYGKKTSQSGSQANDFDFAGQQSDASTGLQYLRARYYDTNTGIFMSRDPMAASPAWLESHFGYAGASPVNASDPTGAKEAWDADGTVATGTGVDGQGTRNTASCDTYWSEGLQYWYDSCSGLVWTQATGWHQYAAQAPPPPVIPGPSSLEQLSSYAEAVSVGAAVSAVVLYSLGASAAAIGGPQAGAPLVALGGFSAGVSDVAGYVATGATCVDDRFQSSACAKGVMITGASLMLNSTGIGMFVPDYQLMSAQRQLNRGTLKAGVTVLGSVAGAVLP